jgi:hypothetical protein
VALHDVNGAPIVGPFSGWDLYQAHKWGGYAAFDDPALSPSFSAVGASGGNFSFLLRVPVEIGNRDALGALPNMNASSTYKLRLALAPSNRIYTTPPGTTLPTVRFRVWAECWAPPSSRPCSRRRWGPRSSGRRTFRPSPSGPTPCSSSASET